MKLNKMILVGRDEEKKTLEAVYRSKTAEFIAVYGRRRVGKTFLIKTAFQQKNVLFFHITGTLDASMHEHIDDFTRVIESTFYNSELTIKNPDNWKQAFELLTKAIQREPGKKTIILF